MAKVTDDFPDAVQLRRRRSNFKRRYATQYGQLEKLLFEHDPIGIGYVPDEYDPEVEMILPKVSRVRNERELTDAVHSVFQRMFSADIAGPRKKYEPIARDIWQLMRDKSDVSQGVMRDKSGVSQRRVGRSARR